MMKNQKGFTLIEIIAVLVILGILAAVAVPKYMDLTKEAANKAAIGAVAAAKSALSMAYAQYLLTNSNAATTGLQVSALITTGNCGVGDGDFLVTCTGLATKYVTITATGTATTSASGGKATGTFQLP